MAKKGLISRDENYSEWYNQLVEAADLAQKSEVRGCMIIKPYGFAIWESIKNTLDQMFKSTKHKNLYFPMFIPKSYLSAEANHVEGFAKECAVVTHYRLRSSKDGGVEVDPDAKLEEELILRPTSETIIWKTYKDWIRSHRDLPLLYNQWANVVRWEMRTRIFLRTTEFLWQEGHTAHATKKEAEDETQKMLHIYNDLMQNYLAIDGVVGVKSPSETFAGAVNTYTIESMMGDKKALQSCTSHFLGQNFAKAFDVTFKNSNNEDELVRATSWGLSTRIMGALIMSHSDDQGLVLPPAVAPIHVVVVPIYKTSEELDALYEYVQPLYTSLNKNNPGTINFHDDDEKEYECDPIELGTSKFNKYAHGGVSNGVRTDGKYTISRNIVLKIDSDDQKSPGWKFAQWELQGVPVRVAVGKRDMENGVVEITRRDTFEKELVKISEAGEHICSILQTMQEDLLFKNKQRRIAHTYLVDSRDEFKEKVDGGFVLAHWDGTDETEAAIKEETKATIRCIPFDQPDEEGPCIYSGKPSTKRVLFAKAY